MRRHCSSETMVTLVQWRSSGKVTVGDGGHEVTLGGVGASDPAWTTLSSLPWSSFPLFYLLVRSGSSKAS